jgi:hypothetical protein
MANKIYLSQRSIRHVVKRLDASYLYDASFGIWQTLKIDNTGLNFPWMIATDGTFIYVCDGNNQRIVKLTNALVFVSSLDISTEIGRPNAIMYDGAGSLYVAGIRIYRTLSVAKIDTATFTVSKSNNNIYAADTNDQPMGISAGFVAGTFLISGMTDLLKVSETGGGFGTATPQAIGGEAGTRFYGNLMHSDGNLYLIKKNALGSFIEKVNSSYINVGDSDRISKSASYISQGLSNSMLVYDTYDRKIVRYDQYMNYVEDVYSDTGSTVQLDAEDICGIVELSI